MSEPVTASQRLLRMALAGNAAFSAISAAIIVMWQSALVRYLGIPKEFGILFLGIGLMVFAVWLLLSAGQTQIKIHVARMAVGMDLAWVAFSIPVVVLAPLTSRGKWVVMIVAVIVLCFAITQWIGIRRISDSKEKIQEVRSA